MRTERMSWMAAAAAMGVVALLLVSACEDGGAGAPAQESRVSECGGFAASALTTADGAPDDYCAAEVIDWTYDAPSATLTLRNERVLLNCCGEHAIRAARTEDGYLVTETDDPEHGARCGCMCVFDYTIAIGDAPAGAVALHVDRVVSDDEDATRMAYEGSLDTTAGAGTIVVDPDDVGPWCQPE